MKHTLPLLAALLLAPLAALHADDGPKRPAPKLRDALEPVALDKAELSGEIGRRIQELIYRNFMVIDLEQKFLDPFRIRPPLPAAKPWRYIGVGKVIAAGSRFAAYTGDAKVAERVDHLVSELMKTRDSDGYLGHIPVEPNGGQISRNWTLHELEYVVLGLVEHARFRSNPDSLREARELADYATTNFVRCPKADWVCTAGLPEALMELHHATSEKRYLDDAASVPHGNCHAEIEFSNLRDWKKTTVRDRNTGHVYVNFARCYAQTQLHRWEPREGSLDAPRFILHELTKRDGDLLVIGSAGDDEHFADNQNGSLRPAESCATAYLIRWLDSLIRLEGDLRHGDIVERAIYNALFAAQDPTGRRIRSFTVFEGPRGYTGDDFCCPGNHRRIMAELPEMVYYRTTDGGIAVNLFTQSSKAIELTDGRAVTIRQETDYPTTGRVKITVTPAEAMEFPLRLRIPRWCPEATLTINGQPRVVSPGQPYCEIHRTWKPGDVLMLDMPMPWRLVRGRHLQEGRAALMRGPVVYCLGSNANAELLKRFKDPRELMIDPATIGRPLVDSSVRPDGLKVTAKAWAPGNGGQGAAPLEVVLTEFVDASGVSTYVRIPDPAQAVEDELLTHQ
jgi:DUF1680 family protein